MQAVNNTDRSIDRSLRPYPREQQSLIAIRSRWINSRYNSIQLRNIHQVATILWILTCRSWMIVFDNFGSVGFGLRGLFPTEGYITAGRPDYISCPTEMSHKRRARTLVNTHVYIYMYVERDLLTMIEYRF